MKRKLLIIFSIVMPMLISMIPGMESKAEIDLGYGAKLTGEHIKAWHVSSMPERSAVITKDNKLIIYGYGKKEEIAKNVKDFVAATTDDERYGTYIDDDVEGYILSTDGKLYAKSHTAHIDDKKIKTVPERTVAKDVKNIVGVDVSSPRGPSITDLSSFGLLYIKKDNTLWSHRGTDKAGKILKDRKIAGKVETAWVYHDLLNSNSQVNINLFLLKTDGNLWGAGYNVWGDLGNGNTKAVSFDKPIKIMDGVKYVCRVSGDGTFKSDEYFTLCILKNNGELYSYGNLDKDFCFLGGSRPKKILDNVKNVSVDGPNYSSQARAVAVTNDGKLYNFGHKAGGESNEFDVEPSVIDTNVSDAVTTVHTVYYIKKDNTLWYVGMEGVGELTGKKTNKPKKLLDKIVTISASSGFSYAIDKDGYLWGWGRVGDWETSPNPFNALDYGKKELKKGGSIGPVRLFKVTK